MDFLDVGGIVAMLKHDPAAVIGFLLVGASATLCFHLHRKLLAVGQDTSALFFRIPNTAIFTRSTRIPHCPFKEWLVTMACIYRVGDHGIATLLAGRGSTSVGGLKLASTGAHRGF